MFTAESLTSKNPKLSDATRSYTCNTYVLTDNNDGGSWKVNTANYIDLIKSGRWGMILREYDIELIKQYLEVDTDRLNQPLVPYGMRHMFGTMSPSQGMASEDYRELTGEYLSEETSGPDLDELSKPHLFIAVNSVGDFAEKLKALNNANPPAKNRLLKSLILPEEIVSSLVFVHLDTPVYLLLTSETTV